MITDLKSIILFVKYCIILLLCWFISLIIRIFYFCYYIIPCGILRKIFGFSQMLGNGSQLSKNETAIINNSRSICLLSLSLKVIHAFLIILEDIISRIYDYYVLVEILESKLKCS